MIDSNTVIKTFIIMLVVLHISIPSSTAQGLSNILAPGDTISGFKVIEQQIIVTRQGMFDYMNGGAELYFDHGWEVLIAADLVGKNNCEFKIEIYRVKTLQNALDLLETQDQLGDTAEIGDKSYYGSGMVVWAQNNYYIRLWAWDEYDSVKDDVLTIAQTISEKLGV